MSHIQNFWIDKKESNKDTVTDCCGCSACASKCPVDAISMGYDEEGFLYPRVDSQASVICLSTDKAAYPINAMGITKAIEEKVAVAKSRMPILYSCHPRSKKRIESTGFELDSRVIQHEPLGFHDYNCLQMNAFAVVSDSGTLPEESSFFASVGHPFPAICIRTSTERPEALDKACFILSGIDEKGLLQSVDTAVELNKAGDYGIPVPDYIEENVSTKVVKIIQSYTGVVNKMVWRKDI